MTLQDLKTQLTSEEKQLKENFFIFINCENSFLANQYLDAISSCLKLPITKIESLNEMLNATSLVLDFANSLNVLRVDTFDEVVENYKDITNTVIICNKVDKKIEELVAPYIIKVPKLLDWQIKDYILASCSSITPDDAEQLYWATAGDIYRIENELYKINLFPEDHHRAALMGLIYSDDSSLYNIDMFKFKDAIMKDQKAPVLDYLKHRQAVELDPFYLTSLLINEYKKIIFIIGNSGKTAKQLGLTDAQANAIKRVYKGYSIPIAARKLRVLTSINYKLVNGLLDIPKDKLFDYIICKVMAVGE